MASDAIDTSGWGACMRACTLLAERLFQRNRQAWRRAMVHGCGAHGNPQVPPEHAVRKAAWGAGFFALPYFPWRLDTPEPATLVVIAAVLLAFAWRMCRRN